MRLTLDAKTARTLRQLATLHGVTQAQVIRMGVLSAKAELDRRLGSTVRPRAPYWRRSQPRSAQRRKAVTAEDETRLVTDTVALATTYGRYGYRRITPLLRQRSVRRPRTSRPARPGRTAMSRASTPSSGTSCSMGKSSTR
jgi:hypothetical protein